ncbi:MAG: type II toxin-antitoxin system RelB/DinJ family antitoxin [Clostridia bacterium]|nr:type II toxin-antitoxin system RelB/DinJ family antitoxin [Clostridia bacterium]
MNKSSVLTVRLEPTKRQIVAAILRALGLSESTAIDMFYDQIMYCNGLPFDVTLPEDLDIPGVMNLGKMTKEEIDEAVIKTIESSKVGEVMSVDEAMDMFCSMHNIPREKLCK